jgi:hypothetical protein
VSKPSIAVDFDGFIHKYITKVKPWDPTRIADGPVPGAIEWLTRTSKDFDIIIHTCRFTPDEDTEAGWARVIDAVKAVQQWLVTEGLDPDIMASFDYWTSPGKPRAIKYIDDRAFEYVGRFPHKGDIFKRPFKHE